MSLATFLETVERNAGDHPEREAIRFLARGEEATSRLTYAELQRAIEEVAAGLADRELAGKPVILAFAPGVEFVIGIFAVFRAGAFAVTIPVPANVHATRIAAIVADARPAAILAESDDASVLSPALATARIPTYSLERLRSTRALPHVPRAESPALIQYSSGSTREPCGVVVTHGNLAANMTMIGHAFETQRDSVTVSWLPPSHDMGLIGTILAPLFLGTTAILMPPEAIMKRPIRWLRAIDTYRASISGAPNFAYEICDRRVDPGAARELDLSTWRIAFCGAEPIRPRVLHDFADRFTTSGFRRSSFLACYGLVEATLLVSAGPLREKAAVSGDRPRVSCGRPVPGCTVAIDERCSEIFIAGAHVSPGRWSGERRAVVAWDDTFERDGLRFVPTGDVGAIGTEGDVFVLDRTKDVIAIHGRKIHAVDVENAASDADAAVVAAASFAVDSDRGERLVVMCELSAADFARADRLLLAATLGRAVAGATGVAPEIVLLRHGMLPRTASGKIVRRLSRKNYLAETSSVSSTRMAT